MKPATQRKANLSWKQSKSKARRQFHLSSSGAARRLQWSACSPRPHTQTETKSEREGARKMSCDERTALLATGHQRGQRKEPHDIIVVAGKDPKDFEPVFTTADFSYGLTLEELLPFALDPWWQNVRRLCFACLWLTFMLTLLASLCLAYYHDNATACRPTEVLATTLSPPAALALATNGTLLLPS